jgi:hypothetical protein
MSVHLRDCVFAPSCLQYVLRMQSKAQAEYEHRANPSANPSGNLDRKLPAVAWSSPSRRIGAVSNNSVQHTPGKTASRVVRTLFDERLAPLSRPGISAAFLHSPLPASTEMAVASATQTPPQPSAAILPVSRPSLYLSDQERRERRQVFVDALKAHVGSTWAEATLPVSPRRLQRDRSRNQSLMEVRVSTVCRPSIIVRSCTSSIDLDAPTSRCYLPPPRASRRCTVGWM